MPPEETLRRYEIIIEVSNDEKANRDTFRKAWNLLERQVFPELRAREDAKTFTNMLATLKKEISTPYTKDNALDKLRGYRLLRLIVDPLRQEIADGTETLPEAIAVVEYWDTTYAPHYLQTCQSPEQS